MALSPGKLALGAVASSRTVPLLAEAFLLARASAQSGAGITNEGTAGTALDLTASGAEPKVIGPGSWTGEALVGTATLDGGYDVGLSWPADNHTRFTAIALPHHSNSDAGIYSEIGNIHTGDTNSDYWEPALVYDDDGSIYPAQDIDYAGAADPIAFVHSTPAGTWAAGIAEDDYEIIVDADDGAGGHTVDVLKGGVALGSQFADTGTLTLGEPPDERPVQVGPFQHSTLVKSLELLDAIDGDPLIAFDASAPTGWTVTQGGITGPPPRAAWIGGAGNGWQGDDTSLDIGAEDSMTFMFWGRYLGGDVTVMDRNGDSFGGAEAWSLFYNAGFGGFGFGISDATPANFALGSVGTLDPGDEVLFVAVIDRAEDELRVYLDGSQVGAATDISGIGAVSPDAPIVLAVNECFVYAAAIWDRALTDTEITVDLPAALGVS